MSILGKNLPVKMVRAHLDNVPEFALPDGFSLRRYQAGDEAHWLRIHAVADRYNEITQALFRQEFGSDEKLLRERQFYLLDPHGEVIGTGAAWFKDGFEGLQWGRVHWVAIVPEYQGRGLAKPLLTAICRRLRELGHGRAYLSTSTARAAAIRLYLRFGFKPMIRSAEDDAIWKKILSASC
ncbi:MAG: GNAT family N-acetyltransferase [Verrucomicrobia bacterium]|nr:GNAT family N-acetyltransferase [Verrucomicrobiota bacterium]